MTYGTPQGFIDYANERGNTAPAAADEADINAALVRASDYIRRYYVIRSPRPIEPELLEEATYIAATYELATPNFFSKTVTPAESKVLTGLKGITWTIVGNGNADNAMVPRSTDIHMLLQAYVPSDRPDSLIWSIGR